MIKLTIELSVPNRELDSNPMERATSLLSWACDEIDGGDHSDWKVLSAEYQIPKEHTQYQPYLVTTGTRHYDVPIVGPGKNYTLCGSYVQHWSLHENAEFKKDCKICLKIMN